MGEYLALMEDIKNLNAVHDIALQAFWTGEMIDPKQILEILGWSKSNDEHKESES